MYFNRKKCKNFEYDRFLNLWHKTVVPMSNIGGRSNKRIKTSFNVASVDKPI